MSTLVSEPFLAFSPQLAQRIGLDEAILLPALQNVWRLLGQQECHISVQSLRDALPFWSVRELQRISKSLADKGLLAIHSAPLEQSDVFIFHCITDAPSLSRTIDTTRERKPRTAHTTTNPRSALPQSGAQRIAPNWQPSTDILQKIRQETFIVDDFIQQCVPAFVQYWWDRNETRASWDAIFYSNVIKLWGERHGSKANYEQAISKKPQLLTRAWRPNDDILQELTKIGMPHTFINSECERFKLYWIELGVSDSRWNFKFFDWTKKAWAQQQSGVDTQTKLKPMVAHWKPDESMFELLYLDGIPRTFAEEQIAAFRLYWQESGAGNASWSSKFREYVKSKWLTQRQGALNARPQQPHSASDATTTDFIARHTDQAWTKGL